jgi:hypothetical protein
VPDFVQELWSRYEALLWLMAIVSAATLLVSLFLVPYLIIMLPADFYAEQQDRRRLFEARPVIRAVFLLLKNALGALLFLAGVLMIFLPGQGLLTILAGLALLNFPGKRKLEMRFLHAPKVMSSINWLRLRAGREPLSL